MKKLLLASIIALTPSAVMADVERTVEYRQSIYKIVGTKMGVLGAMNKGRIDYDQASAKLAADTIAQLSLIAPEAFSAESVGIDGTEALASYNTHAEDFANVMQAFQTNSAALANVLTTAEKFPRKEFVAMAKTCGGCHDQFKAE